MHRCEKRRRLHGEKCILLSEDCIFANAHIGSRFSWKVLCVAVSFVRDRLAQAGKDTAARALKTELFAALLRQDLAFLEQQDMLEATPQF